MIALNLLPVDLRRWRDARGHLRRRKTHCPSGHAYDQENTRLSSQGYPICRACKREEPGRHEYNRLYRLRNAEVLRAKDEVKRAKPETKRRAYTAQLRKYGLTREQFDAMLVAQCGRCDMCDEQFRDGCGPVVDHDHATTRVRALLCTGCNCHLGRFENSETVRLALNYLARHR